jgi:NADPH-dependent curcumin reductase CurA
MMIQRVRLGLLAAWVEDSKIRFEGDIQSSFESIPKTLTRSYEGKKSF